MTVQNGNTPGNISASQQAAAHAGTRYPRIDTAPGTKYPFKLTGVTFGQNPNNPTFTKLHLGLTKDRFEALNTPDKLPAGHVLEKVIGDPETMTDLFLKDMEKVGGDYGWSARQKYQPQNRADIVEKMDDPETRLYHFEVDGRQVGFCLLSAIKKHRQTKPYEQGIDKHRAVMMFDAQEQQSEAFPKPIEIYKIGLYPDEVGQGIGTAFLNAICNLIFRKGYNMIYLDTRDTNPLGTEEFYAANGFRAFYSQILNNDLAHPVGWPPVLTQAAKNAQQPRIPANNNSSNNNNGNNAAPAPAKPDDPAP